ncbi:hypothetical protein D3C75_634400 [compost metagenome]
MGHPAVPSPAGVGGRARGRGAGRVRSPRHRVSLRPGARHPHAAAGPHYRGHGGAPLSGAILCSPSGAGVSPARAAAGPRQRRPGRGQRPCAGAASVGAAGPQQRRQHPGDPQRPDPVPARRLAGRSPGLVSDHPGGRCQPHHHSTPAGRQPADLWRRGEPAGEPRHERHQPDRASVAAVPHPAHRHPRHQPGQRPAADPQGCPERGGARHQRNQPGAGEERRPGERSPAAEPGLATPGPG